MPWILASYQPIDDENKIGVRKLAPMHAVRVASGFQAARDTFETACGERLPWGDSLPGSAPQGDLECELCLDEIDEEEEEADENAIAAGVAAALHRSRS
jgi:hypothetical protein